ncbi:MAG TPA: thermonuclease family protein [bacterium]|nr:thermonuclease family protein [bacterium]
MRGNISFGALLILLLGVALSACGKKSQPPAEEGVTVVGVIDGDTVELEDGRTIRLVGIDTPERGDTDYDSASALTRRLVLRKRVRLEYDRDQTDRYGRTLAFLWTGDQLVNREIVRAGWAWCYFFEGNLRHSRELLLAQHEAMEAHRGHWKNPQTETAEYYRASFLFYRFHRPECKSMDNVDPDLEVVYYSKDSAFYDGYAPCSRCTP